MLSATNILCMAGDGRLGAGPLPDGPEVLGMIEGSSTTFYANHRSRQ